LQPASRTIDRERDGPVLVDVGDLASGAVLDTRLSWWPVLGDERDVVALA
jgi:hypothetical protein